MKKFKLFLFDNDGTLVDDNRVLSERTRKVLQELHERGYWLGLASGRGYYDLRNYPEKWNLGFDFDIYVCWNGAELYDGIDGQLYKFSYLQPDAIREIIEMVKPLGANPTVCNDDGSMVAHMDPFTSASMQRNRKTWVHIAETEDELYSREAPKVMFRMTDEEMPAFEAYVDAHPSPNFNGYKTQSSVYEFVCPDTEKSLGIRKFCQMHGIGLDEVISFGDTSNDNTMLECSYGVCMANGSDDTKAVAQAITRYTNNEDGLADYIEEHILKEDN